MRPSWPALRLLASAMVVALGCSHEAASSAVPTPAPVPTPAVSTLPAEPPHPLQLQLFNGCAVLASGAPVAKGAAALPYPSRCEDMDGQQVEPHARLELSADVPYTLDQLTLIDSRVNVNTDVTDRDAAGRWIRTQSAFKDLDWTGLKVISDDWLPTSFQEDWRREVLYGDAAWMKAKGGAFLLELLDAQGKPLRSVRYTEAQFYATNPITAHTRLSWEVNGAGAAPGADGGVILRNPPDSPPLFHTLAKLEWARNVDPSATLRLEGVEGDASLRLTWSQLPGHPFYFPIHVTARAQLPDTCFTQDGKRARCDFGLQPRITLRQPANGTFFQPGEETDFFFRVEDGSGHLLHPPDRLPSYDQFFAGDANGLLYFNNGPVLASEDRNTILSFKIAGPLQALVPVENPTHPRALFQVPAQMDGHLTVGELVSPMLAGLPVAGFTRIQTPTRYPVQLPKDAQPGTYVAFLKVNRAFFGERRNVTSAVTFQVGTATPTVYPGAIGGCEKCHQGQASLDRLIHGFPTAQVQGCNACHADVQLNLAFDIHRLHALAPDYTAPRGDCQACHLTRAPTLHATYQGCSSCHETLHGARYAQARFALSGTPNRFESCAKGCHEAKPPKGHTLPAE